MKIGIAIFVAIFATASLSAQSFKVLHTFTNSPDGALPRGGLTLSGATLYGATSEGGSSSNGVLFKISTNGTGFSVIKHFSGSDGKSPKGSLLLSGNTLYGTAGLAGSSSNLVVFRIDTAGTIYSIIKSVAFPGRSGPNGGMVLNGSTLYGTVLGNIYPVAPLGESSIFKINTDGTGFSALYTYNLVDLMYPNRGLVFDNGALYGTTVNYSGGGTVFKVSTNGADYTVIKTFSGSEGMNLNGSMVLSGGTLFGTAANGGAAGQGVIFRMNKDGSDFAVLKDFPALIAGANMDGASPIGGPVLCGNMLFGATSDGGSAGKGVVFKINTDGSGYAVLKTFPAAPYSSGVYTNSEGATPTGDLVINAGVLYGATSSGGRAGQGVLFSVIVPPEIQLNDGLFGILTNRFGFTIAGVSNQAVVVEACTNLATTNWTAVQYKTFGAAPYYFSDLHWTNYQGRFYRVRVQ